MIFFPDYIYWSVGFLVVLVIDWSFRLLQKRHTLLCNFGLLALLRYFLEGIGPEFRQYLYASDTEEKPFNRTERSDVYKKAKNEDTASSFGSLLNFDSTELKLKHSFFPYTEKIEDFSLCFGEERNLKTKYRITKPVLIGGMSFGSLGENAVRALSRGARKSKIPINTGEGGYPKYHLMEGADLIFQIGTAKFGVRKEDGSLDPDKLKSISDLPEVKMIEIKFSQGGKPGKGGWLPKEKITKEIAELRHIPLGQDVFSPARHLECKDSLSTVHFIKNIQEISGLPVGVKFCLGNVEELKELFTTMKKANIFPDYLSIDGSEGGTGAAPKTFMDDLGYPLVTSLKVVENLLQDLNIRNQFKILCAGKLINSGKQIMVLGLGADAIYTARGFLLALGCIQALRCHTNQCPTGITTHSKRFMRGLDIEKKSERVKNYVDHLVESHYELVGALGLKSFKELQKNHIIQL